MSIVKRSVFSCHQPDLFPWIGFFVKLAKSDKFVLLDHVTSNPKDPQNWIRRVKVIGPGVEGDQWLSLPVNKVQSRGGRGVPILDWQYNRLSPAWSKAEALLMNLYRHHPFVHDVLPLLEQFFSDDSRLSEANFSFIQGVLKLLAIDVEIHRSSDFGLLTASNQMLVDCAVYAGSDSYLSGEGSAAYIDPAIFESAGVTLMFNRFRPRPYSQVSRDFVPGLTIIDLLANLGVQGTRDHLFSYLNE